MLATRAEASRSQAQIQRDCTTLQASHCNDASLDADHLHLWMCRNQLCYLSCQGCMHVEDSICEILESCLALNLSNVNISDNVCKSLSQG